MELLREENMLRETNVQSEKDKHNAMINERYQNLLNAVNGQIAEDNVSSQREEKMYNTNVANDNVYISPNTNNSLNYEQTPRVTEYISRASSSIFTADKFEQMTMQTPTATMVQPIIMPDNVEEVSHESQYSLTKAAKIAIASFALLTVGMLTMIGVNTNAINQKKMNIEALETRKAELVEMNEAVQERIENAISEETIRDYAESQGMVKSN